MLSPPIFSGIAKTIYGTYMKRSPRYLYETVYDFSCPGCDANYIVKTERTLYERTVEHAWRIATVLFNTPQ